MSVGALGYAGFGVDSASGNASSTVTVYAPIISENLVTNLDFLDSQNVRAQWDVDRVYNGLQRVQGTITAQAHFLTAGLFFRAAMDVCTAVNSTYLAASATLTHIFKNGQTQFQAGSGSDLPTYTIEINRGPVMGVGSSFMYYGCAGSALEFSIEAGQLARMSVDFIGRRAGGKAKSTPTFPPTGAILWSQCSVSLGGGGSALFQSLTVRIDNALEAIAKLDGTTFPDLIKRNNFRQVQVNGRLQFQTFSEYDRFLAGSELGLKVTFTGQTLINSGQNEYLVLDIPAFKYTGFPLNISGPGQLAIDFNGRGVYHEGSGTSMQVWLVNTRQVDYTCNTPF